MGEKSRRWKDPVNPQYWAAGPKRFAWATRMIDWEDDDPAHKLAPFYSDGKNDPFTGELMEAGRYSELLSLTAEKIGSGTKIAVDVVPRNVVERSENIYTYLSQGSELLEFKSMSNLGASIEMRLQLLEPDAVEKYAGVELEIPTDKGNFTYISAMNGTLSGTTLSIITPTDNREAVMPYIDAFAGKELVKIAINPKTKASEPYVLSVDGVPYNQGDLTELEKGVYSIGLPTSERNDAPLVTAMMSTMLDELSFMVASKTDLDITGLSAFGYTITDIGYDFENESRRVYAIYSDD
ncbi:MAG: hypothetical protein GOU99_03100 [Candidatus Altiarchaeota archaeon]|nr:hypothetical protein [Candidatus Altiarchaeota archaeon]